MHVISVIGAREHNLRDVSVDIPKNKLVAFTGVSGSGKSSLVFDTLYIEAFRRFADASQAPVYVMGSSIWARASRPRFQSIKGLPPALGLSQRQGVAGKLSTVGTISGVSDLLRVYFAAFGEVHCRNCDIPLRATSFTDVMTRLYADYAGKKVVVVAPIAEKRKGGFATEIEKFRQLGFSKIRVNGTTTDLQDEDVKIRIDAKKLNTIEVLIDFLAITEDKRKRLERAVGQAIEYGKGVVKIEQPDLELQVKFNTKSSCPQCGESAPRLDPRYFSHSSLGQCAQCAGTGSKGEDLPSDLFPCGSCKGSRLSNSRPIVRVQTHTFEGIQALPLPALTRVVMSELVPAARGDKARMRVVDELQRVVATLGKMGLGHLTLNRAGSSLSPGDLQRLRLAAMLSNRLTGALYVLDEPCQGLTATEVGHLVKVLEELVTQGASVVVVEHHPVFLSHCHQVYVMGPGAGVKGGHIVGTCAGNDLARFEATHFGESELTNKSAREARNKALVFTQEQQEAALPPRGGRKGKEKALRAAAVAAAATSHTKAQSQVSEEPVGKAAKPSKLIFENIAVRNLVLPRLEIPQAAVTILRGDAGRGKTSFLELCLLPALSQLLESDKPSHGEFYRLKCEGNVSVSSVDDVRPGSLTRSSRRSVAAALEVIQPVREIFAQVPSSQVLGLTEMHFSWNSKLGRCENCEGRGYIELMQRYGPPVRVECEVCFGAKLGTRSLLPRFKGYNLADVMGLDIEEASQVFAHVRQIHQRLSRAVQFGLGYVKLGQSMDSLSGGELQRLTLTMELKRVQLAGTWFLLVHPGTGLHAPDIRVLGELMQLMVSRGATFVVLENREEFLEFAHQVVKF